MNVESSGEEDGELAIDESRDVRDFPAKSQLLQQMLLASASNVQGSSIPLFGGGLALPPSTVTEGVPFPLAEKPPYTQLLMRMAQHASLRENLGKLLTVDVHPLDLRVDSQNSQGKDVVENQSLSLNSEDATREYSRQCLQSPFNSSDSQVSPQMVSLRALLESQSQTGRSEHMPQRSESMVELSDEELTKLSVKELNKRLFHVPKLLQDEVKKKRRTLKNRGYAQACRTKRVAYQKELKQIIKGLQKENTDTRKEVSRLSQQIILYKSENSLLKDDIENLKMQLKTTNKLEKVKQQSNICHKCKNVFIAFSSSDQEHLESGNRSDASTSSSSTTEF
ncbi:hypothetical protein SK128_010624 [Halocaridina rubra]|uniref:BZIP domain-containing protein n=1 Tax=Halocaridina rubra TaxID=373956 RepID=A0AAN8WYX4_HALRR